jgi:cobalt-zinc-cadmium efflux system outer membrane protein
MQADKAPDKPDQVPGKPEGVRPRLELNIPPEIPGSEAPLVKLPKDKAALQREVARLYPELPPLPAEPTALPGPDGHPYTLADLQQLAAANSPALRQAASDVEAAKGNLIQARAYPNPTFGFETTPSNNGSTAGADGFFIDQVIKTGGKLKLAAAAAEMDLRNAELALKRARSDLATNVRNAYYGLIVAKESMRVGRALARFTDDIYRLQTGLLGTVAAPYEPAALRAQAYLTRLAYKQAISTYIYSWKQLVATVGLRQLPLTEVAGRVDRLIPYYDYDAVLAHVLHHHTDVLTARNGLEKARFNLKLAQVTPVPDVEVRADLLKEYALTPFQFVQTISVGIPLPVWDQNKGAIMAAQGALVRASEEPHRVEVTLTNTLATAYTNYKNNLDALEYYRRNILPDQVRTYRGAFERRQVDITAAFADLVTAQQTLVTGVTTYLSILGTLWTSAVSVADLLQTDDLFQLGKPHELPELPDLEHPPAWACHHPIPAPGYQPGCGEGACQPAPPGPAAPPPAALTPGAALPVPPAGGEALWPPRPLNRPAAPRVDRGAELALPPQPGGQRQGTLPAALPDPLLTPPPALPTRPVE